MKSLVHALGRSYQRRVLQSEFEHQRFVRHNERPMEFAFVFQAIGKCAPKTVLDVGTGTTALPALIANCGAVVTAIDNVTDYWEDKMLNRHWHVLDEDIQKPTLSQHFDMITCISVLEHIKDHRIAMRNMLALLRTGGHLVLTCPYTDRQFIADTYRVPNADSESSKQPYICNSYSRTELEDWLRDGNAELVDAQYWKGFTGKHWAMGTRIAPPQPSTREADHNLACLLLRKS